MRNIYHPIVTFISALLMLSALACSRPMTTQKVTENIEDARKATAEANDALRQAIESREQLYDDYREGKIEELEDKMKGVDNRIKELQKTSNKSENQGAKSDINSAVKNLENEKRDIRAEIEKVKAIPKQDWSTSYQAVEQAIEQLQLEIQRLTISLTDYE